MSLVAVTIKVRREVAELAEEMVRLGIARSRDQAYNMLIELGIREARRLVEERRRARALVEEFMRRGPPYPRLPTARDAEEERSR